MSATTPTSCGRRSRTSIRRRASTETPTATAHPTSSTSTSWPTTRWPRTDLRCPVCNRGPGNQNDFRLRIESGFAKLDRGKVYVAEVFAQGTTLTVPTPDGTLAIVISGGTEVKDGEPLPGAEIRAEGSVIADGVVLADRVDVLCPAPASIPPTRSPTTPLPLKSPHPRGPRGHHHRVSHARRSGGGFRPYFSICR